MKCFQNDKESVLFDTLSKIKMTGKIIGQVYEHNFEKTLPEYLLFKELQGKVLGMDLRFQKNIFAVF